MKEFNEISINTFRAILLLFLRLTGSAIFEGKSLVQWIALQKGAKSEKKWQLMFTLVFKTWAFPRAIRPNKPPSLAAPQVITHLISTAIKDETLCLLIALIKTTFRMQLIDKFTDWNGSYKSDTPRCRNQTRRSESAAAPHLTARVISTDNYSSAGNGHITVKSEGSAEEHPLQALHGELAPGLTALPFHRLILLHHPHKTVTWKIKGCSASVPQNVGIGTASALVSQDGGFWMLPSPIMAQHRTVPSQSYSWWTLTWTQQMIRPVRKTQRMPAHSIGIVQLKVSALWQRHLCPSWRGWLQKARWRLCCQVQDHVVVLLDRTVWVKWARFWAQTSPRANVLSLQPVVISLTRHNLLWQCSACCWHAPTTTGFPCTQPSSQDVLRCPGAGPSAKASLSMDVSKRGFSRDFGLWHLEAFFWQGCNPLTRVSTW